MILQIQQNTAEWLSERVGRVTASRVKDVMCRLKNGAPGADRERYLWELICERRTGRAAEHYVTPAMEHGSEFESYARAAYEVESGNEVDKAGIAIYPRLEYLAASPDGLIGTDGLFEAKCPTTVKHYKWMLNGEVPEEHRDQCYAQMMCWEREWVDFVSFDPRVPESDQLFTKRLYWDDKRIAAIEFAVVEFDAEVNEMIAKLNGRNPFKEKLRKAVELSDPYLTDEDIEYAKSLSGR